MERIDNAREHIVSIVPKKAAAFEGLSLPILLISLVFGLKALFLAFWVTPLWGVPDEIGHFSYARDLAEGKGIPRLGEAVIGEDIMAHVKNTENALPRSNWIAQHPPIYYLIAAIPLKIGGWLTNEPEVLYRLPRIASAVFGALLILVIFRTLVSAGVDSGKATALAAAIGFVPMVSHLSSGTNHDIGLLFFCALATHSFVRYMLHRGMRDAYWCAGWLAVAGGIKMTAWALAAPMVAIMLFEMRGSPVAWMRHAISLSLLGGSTAFAWMLRNYAYFGTAIYTSGTARKAQSLPKLDNSLADYLQLQPVFEHFVLNFYGLMGWAAGSFGKMSWFQIGGAPRSTFSVALFVLASTVLMYTLFVIKRTYGDSSLPVRDGSLRGWIAASATLMKWKRPILLLTLVLGLAVAVFLELVSYVAPLLSGHLRIVAVTISVFVGLVSIPSLLFTERAEDRLLLYATAVFFVFGSVLLYKVYGAYLFQGGLRATHGRYLYPVIPLLIAAVSISLMRLRVPTVIVTAGTAALALMELETYALQAIPFYLAQGN